MFSVFFSNKAKKQYAKLEAKIHDRAAELLEFLESEPVPAGEYDVSKLSGRDETYRIRLSSFRFVYRVLWNEKKIEVAKIERRSDNTY